MLDQLSGGRFDFGVGRGVSPFELEYFGVAATDSPAILKQNVAAILEAYRTGVFTHPGGERPTTRISVLPVQTPHPPLWYASGSVETAVRAGTEGTNLVGRWEDGALRPIVDGYWEAWHAAHDSGRSPGSASPRTLCIGESDAAAQDRYLQAAGVYWDRLISLWHENGVYGADSLYDPQDMLEKSNAIVGSAATVRDRLAALLEETDINYFELTMTYGDLTVEEAFDQPQGDGGRHARAARGRGPAGASRPLVLRQERRVVARDEPLPVLLVPLVDEREASRHLLAGGAERERVVPGVDREVAADRDHVVVDLARRLVLEEVLEVVDLVLGVIRGLPESVGRRIDPGA